MPKTVFAIHGLGGHSGWFDNLAQALKPKGVNLVAYDLPGFGKNHQEANPKSKYLKGHIDSYQEWIDFAQSKYQALKQELNNAPITVLGHSLGGVVAVNLDINADDSLILSVPGFKGAKATFDPGFVLKTFGKVFIDKWIFARDVYLEMPVSSKTEPSPALDDPLRVGTVTQTLLFEILKMGGVAKKNLSKIEVPTLMLQIENDAVVDIETQDKYFDLIKTSNKEKKLYSGSDHDWIWTPANQVIAEDIFSWMAS